MKLATKMNREWHKGIRRMDFVKLSVADTPMEQRKPSQEELEWMVCDAVHNLLTEHFRYPKMLFDWGNLVDYAACCDVIDWMDEYGIFKKMPHRLDEAAYLRLVPELMSNWMLSICRDFGYEPSEQLIAEAERVSEKVCRFRLAHPELETNKEIAHDA